MAYIIESAKTTVSYPLPKPKLPTSRSSYEIPERYQNSFYLANASLSDSVNWFLHRAYEVIYPTLKERLKKLEPHRTDIKSGEMVEGMFKVMDQCNSLIDVRFPVKRENGRFEVFRGLRVQHGLAAGYQASLGGFRMGENITRDHMQGLAALATYRNACMGIGMAGAHGGLKIDPKEFTEKELQYIIKEYASALIDKGYCNTKDVMQPDINSSQREMTWISKALASYNTESSRLAASGKHMKVGGIDSYNEMSYQGVYLALKNILKNEDLMKRCNLPPGLEGKTFVIQGIGKLGAPLAQLLVKNGAICVGVKDEDAYIYIPQGLDLDKLYDHKRRHGTFKYYDIAKPESSDAIYKERCDLLIFAGQHKSLNCYIAEDIKARVIVEAADNPVTPSSHRILTEKSHLVVPDIYACSGATVASYVEYLWNLQKLGKLDNETLRLSDDVYKNLFKQSQVVEDQKAEVQSRSSISASADPIVLNRTAILDTIDSILTNTEKEMFKYTELLNLGTDIRTAAYIVGINNIFKSLYEHKRFF